MISSPATCASVSARPYVSTRPMATSTPRRFKSCASFNIVYVLPTPGAAPMGTREEKLEQLDEAIQELLDIKVLECAADHPNVRFIAAPRAKPQGGTLVAVILGLLALLVWMLGVHPGTW